MMGGKSEWGKGYAKEASLRVLFLKNKVVSGNVRCY